MKKLIVLLFLISSLAGLSQEINLPKDALKSKVGKFLVLTNGTCIECTKIKLPGYFNERIKYTTSNNQTEFIDQRELEAIVDVGKGEILYSRQSDLGDYVLVPRTNEGRIKIYEYVTNVLRSDGTANREVSHFLEKGYEFRSIVPKGILTNNKAENQTLLSLVGDLPLTKSVVEDPNYKNTKTNIFKIINTYNLFVYESEKGRNTSKLDSTLLKDIIKMNFIVNKKIADSSYILTEDGKKYLLNKMNKASVPLPRNISTKICLVIADIQYCSIVVPIFESNRFFEIKIEDDFIYFSDIK